MRRGAAEILELAPRLDVLVNNAGLIQTLRSETVDGFETTFAVNHLGPFLLTNLLLDRLVQSTPARIVNVASTAHSAARHGMPFDDLQSTRRYRAMRVYGQSKLANILFTLELARRLSGTGVTANSLHPGTVRTGYGADGDARGFLAFGIKIAAPFFLSPAKGARTSVYLASSPEVEGVSGEYFVKCKARAAQALGAGPRGRSPPVAGERGAGRPAPAPGELSRARPGHRRGPGHRPGHRRGAGRPGPRGGGDRPRPATSWPGSPAAQCLALDVTDDASVAAAVAAAGELDAVVNNAGVPGTGPLETYPLDAFARVLEVNTLGPLRMAQAVVPAWRERGSGVLVNISSVQGKIGTPLEGAYAASKHALEALSETLHFELGHFGIRVVIVEPGYIAPG